MFGRRLRKLREENGLTLDSLAAEYNRRFFGGLNKGTLSKYENGKQEPMITVVRNLAEYFNVSVDYLTGNSDTKTSEESSKKAKGVKIPVLGNVAAGVPIDAIEDIIDYEEIDEETAKTGEFFGLRIKGDSMTPRIAENDIVIVKKTSTVNSGELAVVLINGESATVKKYIRHDNGISLIPFNPAYEPMFFTIEEIETLPVSIIGKVVELRAKF